MLNELSNQIADIVEAAAPSVVQVQGGRAPAGGLAYGPELVLTTGRAAGHDDQARVRRADGETFAAEVAGRDASTHLVLLKVPGLSARPLTPGSAPRVGNLAIAVARSWSN